MTTYLKVDQIENFEATNGREYQKVTFRLLKFEGTMQIKTSQVRSRNIWDETMTTDGRVINAHPYFKTLKIGDLVDGNIVTLNTIPYTIGENTINQWTGVVFEGENPITVANNQLTNNNACVVDEHGQPTKEISFAPVTKPEVKVTSKFE